MVYRDVGLLNRGLVTGLCVGVLDGEWVVYVTVWVGERVGIWVGLFEECCRLVGVSVGDVVEEGIVF